MQILYAQVISSIKINSLQSNTNEKEHRTNPPKGAMISCKINLIKYVKNLVDGSTIELHNLSNLKSRRIPCPTLQRGKIDEH